MNVWNDSRSSRSLLIIPALLLALGLILDFGFTRPRLTEVQRLEEQRARLFRQDASRAANERDGRELARCLGAADLPSALALQTGEDPVNFLGSEVERAGLSRVQLASRAAATTGGLRQSDFVLRVQGSYAGIQSLIRSLESGPRVVAVNALSIMPASPSPGAPGSAKAGSGVAGALEAQLDVSVYDVPGGRP